jgi:predicted nucleotidyltransferase
MEQPHDVAEILDLLLVGIKDALANNLVGIYLRGSLATGDFDPAGSDIDFLVVTERPVSTQQFDLLAALHGRLAHLSNRYGNDLEGAYLPREAAKRFTPGDAHPTIYRGEDLRWSEHGSNWLLERWTVREQGTVLFGPEPKTLIDPISSDDLREAVRVRLGDWAEWARDTSNPEWQQGTLGHKAYVVETMCRALFTLREGKLCSKPRAVEWALGALPEPWRSTVVCSQVWHNSRKVDPTVIPEVRDFVLWTAASAEALSKIREQ